jgi:hypothetical protein
LTKNRYIYDQYTAILLKGNAVERKTICKPDGNGDDPGSGGTNPNGDGGTATIVADHTANLKSKETLI